MGSKFDRDNGCPVDLEKDDAQKELEFRKSLIISLYDKHATSILKFIRSIKYQLYQNVAEEDLLHDTIIRATEKCPTDVLSNDTRALSWFFSAVRNIIHEYNRCIRVTSLDDATENIHNQYLAETHCARCQDDLDTDTADNKPEYTKNELDLLQAITHTLDKIDPCRKQTAGQRNRDYCILLSIGYDEGEAYEFITDTGLPSIRYKTNDTLTSFLASCFSDGDIRYIHSRRSYLKKKFTLSVVSHINTAPATPHNEARQA